MGYTTALASTKHSAPGWKLYADIAGGPNALNQLRGKVLQAQNDGYVDIHADTGFGAAAPKKLYVYEPTKGSGGASGGGSAGPGAGAAAAASAYQPTLSGAHVGLSRGPVEQADTMVERQGAFLGVNTAVPEGQMRPGESPWCKNVHGARPAGAISFRRGCMKLVWDRDTVNDGLNESCTLTCVAKASYAADSDYVLFTKPNGDTHAFWFDTTGSDTEPTGSQNADASTAVDISADTTAADVADALTTAIDGASIGLNATDAGGGVVSVASTTAPWFLNEFVANSSFAITDFVLSSGTALDAAFGGLSAEPLENPTYDGITGMLLTFVNPQSAYIGETATAVKCVVVKQEPLYGKQGSLANVTGPTLVPADGGSQSLQATVSHPRGGNYGEVVAVTIRYSTRGFPIDVDGNDDNSREAGNDEIDPDPLLSGFLTNADRGTWDGSSTAFSKTVAAGTYYVTAWAHSREGTTKPTRGLVVIA